MDELMKNFIYFNQKQIKILLHVILNVYLNIVLYVLLKCFRLI